MNYITIPNFESLSKQEIFDISVKHVLKNGKPSVKYGGECIYSGIGCAAAPFIQEDKRKEADEHLMFTDGNGNGWNDLYASGKVPAHERSFVYALQLCHDVNSHHTDESVFIQGFKDSVMRLAGRHNLFTSALTKEIFQ